MTARGPGGAFTPLFYILWIVATILVGRLWARCRPRAGVAPERLSCFSTHPRATGRPQGVASAGSRTSELLQPVCDGRRSDPETVTQRVVARDDQHRATRGGRGNPERVPLPLDDQRWRGDDLEALRGGSASARVAFPGAAAAEMPGRAHRPHPSRPPFGRRPWHRRSALRQRVAARRTSACAAGRPPSSRRRRAATQAAVNACRQPDTAARSGRRRGRPTSRCLSPRRDPEPLPRRRRHGRGTRTARGAATS